MTSLQEPTTLELPLRPLLTFTDAALELRFLRYYEAFYCRYAQASLLLGAILVGADWLVDFLAYPEIAANHLRLQWSVPILLLGFLLSFYRLGKAYWQGLMTCVIVLVAFSLYWALGHIDIEHGSGLSSWVGILNYTFFEFYCFVILGIGFRYALPAGTIVMGGFLGAVHIFMPQSFSALSYLSYHVVTVFLLAAMIGWWREYLLRKEFSVLEQLERATQLAQTQAAFLAEHDALTGLHNLEWFTAELRREEQLAHAKQLPVPLLLISAKGLRRTRDAMGQAAADKLMLALVRRLRDVGRDLSPAPVLARTASFEIAVLLRHLTQTDAVIEIAERYLDAVKEPFFEIGPSCYLHALGGLAIYPHDGASLDATLKAARVAIATASDDGRSLHFYNADLDRKLNQRLAQEDDLRNALGAGQFTLAYQPLVCLGNRNCVGVEALLRWTHPVHGSVPPVEFIPILEELGLIHDVGDWVLNQACHQASVWRRSGKPLDHMAINVSGVQLADAKLTDKVAKALNASGLDAQCLVLELTESVLVHDNLFAVEQLQSLKTLGLRLALDDFGTGYSSLVSITKFPLDIIKLDRSFVQAATTDHSAFAIIEASLAMAARLRISTVAEGVEDEHQAALLNRMGCPLAQGYLFSRPASAEEVGQLLVHQISE